MITFAIVCHDEADTVGTVVENAFQATRHGDRVIVVDSASTDGTADAARSSGAEVLTAPLGKGAAMALAVQELQTEWVCFLDGDLTHSARNIPAVLADAVRRGERRHVVGEFDDGLGAVLTNTDGFYRPLIGALFPEVASAFGSKPLTGFRALHRDAIVLPLPRDYGVEVHLNITTTLTSGAPLVVDIGRFTGKMKTNRVRTTEITTVLLDLAERYGRLDPAVRPAWDAWIGEVLEVSLAWDAAADQRAYARTLLRAAARPLPPRHTVI